MQTHLLNLYEIANLAELSTRYRLVKIDGPFGLDRDDDDLVERNLSLLTKMIAFHERVPVALVRRDHSAFLAVPAALKLSNLDYPLSPHVVTLQPQQETEELDFSKWSPDTGTVGLAFLRYHLSSPLMHNDSLWNYGTSSYYCKRPVNFKQDSRDVDVYEGFGFRLVVIDGRVYLAISLKYKYVHTAWLVEAYDEAGMRGLKMRHMLYHFGHRWYPVQFLDLVGRSVGETRFMPDGSAQPISVQDYTIQKAGSHPPNWVSCLDPKSPAIFYRSPGNEKRRYGAAALCKLMLSTDDPRVKGMHRLSVKSPEERFRLTTELVRTHFSEACFEGHGIVVAPAPLRRALSAFSVPDLRFGQGTVLKTKSAAYPSGVSLRGLGKTRMDYLLDQHVGLAVSGTLDPQYFIAPESLPREVVEDFQNRLTKTVRQFTHVPCRMEFILYDDKGARTLKQQVDAIVLAIQKAGVTHGHRVLVLPEHAKPALHNYIKRTLHETLQLQCVSAGKVNDFYAFDAQNGRPKYLVRRDLEGRYISYLRYTALGLMIVNRQWPWVLDRSTKYDVYIGLDVLNNTAAFTFFYEGGRKCFVRSCRSQQKEKLLRRQLRSVIYEHLRQDLQGAVEKPRSVILRRDGKLFHGEWLGFQDAVRQLIADGLLPSNVLIGAVEVHKHSALGIRIVAERDGGLVNARVGTWFALSDREGVVCTTGYPFTLPGTANPLTVRIVRGALTLHDVLEDTFVMSLLSWPVPDRCMRLPIDIKLCDDFLRSVAADADDDEATFGGESPETDADQEGVVSVRPEVSR